MKDRDLLCIKYIKNHYDELCDEIKLLNDSFEEYKKNIVVKKAIRMDVLQIGEHFSHLSDEFTSKFNKKDIKGIIDVRNFIAHGYVVIDEKILWTTIHEDIPRLIKQIDDLIN